ncbi:Glycoside hydrolase family 51 protein [Mycena indigotica]|uniref:Glycoside hydrolase family 51 protein n=1 Tax=Mycena indigotica TaxID=2126181 RepID=A0A8H6W7C2_9AGAR|nr:Glycoside hydrolase family 51 protein [Mycena indigotica]KAF7307532.1 Glycoside hydrolase family 51 protein [Mycena indigotica]
MANYTSYFRRIVTFQRQTLPMGRNSPCLQELLNHLQAHIPKVVLAPIVYSGDEIKISSKPNDMLHIAGTLLQLLLQSTTQRPGKFWQRCYYVLPLNIPKKDTSSFLVFLLSYSATVDLHEYSFLGDQEQRSGSRFCLFPELLTHPGLPMKARRHRLLHKCPPTKKSMFPLSPATIGFHEYSSPSWFTNNSFMFDDYPRNGTQFFVGEYACTSTNDTNTLGDLPSGRLAYPTLEGSAAEAAFMTGMERNSDVVFASAFFFSAQQMPRAFNTSATSSGRQISSLTMPAGSSSQRHTTFNRLMFSLNKGTHVLSTTPAPSPDTAPLFWVASYHNETDVVFLKVSNTGLTDLVAHVFLSTPATSLFVSAVSLSSPALSQDPVSGQFNVSNTLDKPNQIIPVSSSFAFQFNDKFNYTFPATSITVQSFTVGEGVVQT